MIDEKAARESCNNSIIDYVIWIKRKFNLADAMRKTVIISKVMEAMHKIQLHYEKEQWVNRTTRLPTNKKKNADCETIHDIIPRAYTAPGTNGPGI